MTTAPRGRPGRTLALIALVVAAPVAMSYAFYYLFPRATFTNYGELLPTTPAPAIVAMQSDGSELRLAQPSGRWIVVVTAPGACDAACAKRLYATRQARTIQGKDMDRVQRLWLVSDGAAPSPSTRAEHPDLVLARVAATDLARLPRGAEAIYLVDPLGNQVLAWPADPDIKALAKDIARLLKASRIG